MKKGIGVIKILEIIFLGSGFVNLCAGMTFFLIDLFRGIAGSDRFIRFQMHADHGALFIGCVNSTAAGESGAQPRRERTERHGYGLVAMRRIAEKYDSILKVDSGSGEFSVKTNLSMR